MPMYYRDARAAILVYDITKAETFDNMKFWVRELKTNAPDDILIVLVGNKFPYLELISMDCTFSILGGWNGL